MEYARTEKVMKYLKKPLGREILITMYHLSTKDDKITKRTLITYYGFNAEATLRMYEAMKLGLLSEWKEKGLFKPKYLYLTEDGENLIAGQVYIRM